MKLAFVSGINRSGTTLVQQLLDGHPKLAVWPKEWNLLRRHGHLLSNDKRPFKEYLDAFEDEPTFRAAQEGKDVGTKTMGSISVSRIKSYNPHFRSRLYKELDSGENCCENKKNPAKELNTFLSFEEAICQVGESFRANSDIDAFVIKATDCVNFALYPQVFPHARFVMVMRNPLDLLVSAIYPIVAKRQPVAPLRRLGAYDTIQYANIDAAYRYITAWRSDPRFCYLRLEDLVEDPEKVMKEIASFLSIDYDECLLEPTVFGLPHKTNFADPLRQGIGEISSPESYQSFGLTQREKNLLIALGVYVQDFYPDVMQHLGEYPTVNRYARLQRMIRSSNRGDPLLKDLRYFIRSVVMTMK